MADWRSRITATPDIRSGKPRVKGTRITVADVLDYLSGGMTAEEVVEELVDLDREDVLACLAFAADSERWIVRTTVPA